jgi:uncharacterized membrane protein
LSSASSTTKLKRSGRWLTLYTKLRTGKAFLLILTCFCAFWIAWNELPFLPHFDDSMFGRLTLFLSVEASLATSMLIMANEKAEEAQRKTIQYMMDLMVAQRDTMNVIRGLLEKERHYVQDSLDAVPSDQAQNVVVVKPDQAA